MGCPVATLAQQLLRTGPTCRGGQTCWETQAAPLGGCPPSPPPGRAPSQKSKGSTSVATHVLLTRGWERTRCPWGATCGVPYFWPPRQEPSRPFRQRTRHKAALCLDSLSSPCLLEHGFVPAGAGACWGPSACPAARRRPLDGCAAAPRRCRCRSPPQRDTGTRCCVQEPLSPPGQGAGAAEVATSCSRWPPQRAWDTGHVGIPPSPLGGGVRDVPRGGGAVGALCHQRLGQWHNPPIPPLHPSLPPLPPPPPTAPSLTRGCPRGAGLTLPNPPPRVCVPRGGGCHTCTERGGPAAGPGRATGCGLGAVCVGGGPQPGTGRGGNTGEAAPHDTPLPSVFSLQPFVCAAAGAGRAPGLPLLLLLLLLPISAPPPPPPAAISQRRLRPRPLHIMEDRRREEQRAPTPPRAPRSGDTRISLPRHGHPPDPPCLSRIGGSVLFQAWLTPTCDEFGPVSAWWKPHGGPAPPCPPAGLIQPITTAQHGAVPRWSPRDTAHVQGRLGEMLRVHRREVPR